MATGAWEQKKNLMASQCFWLRFDALSMRAEGRPVLVAYSIPRELASGAWKGRGTLSRPVLMLPLTPEPAGPDGRLSPAAHVFPPIIVAFPQLRQVASWQPGVSALLGRCATTGALKRL